MVKQTNSKTNKVFIIGLDGGTWKVLGPLMDQGKMPYLKKLLQQGASGTLKSTIPPVTAPAWASFQTGVNPGKHGIFDFQVFHPHTRESTIVNSQSIPLNTIWDLASSAGKKVITINVPLTYPPKKDRNRVTIGGMLSPKVDPSLIHPRELFGEFIHSLGYKITSGPLERRISTKLVNFIQEEIEVEKTRFKVARQLAEKKPWDLFMLHVQSSDHIQHCFYPYLDPNSSGYDPDKWKIIAQFYQVVDQEIERLIQLVEGNTTVVILSDHGFGPLNKYINLNTWLREEGLLSISGPNLLGRLGELIRKYDVFRIRKRIFARFLSNILSVQNIATNINNQAIDWLKTRAFMPNGTIFGGIFINNEKRRKHLQNDIVEGLQRLSDPITGQRVIQQIYDKSKVFSGPYLHLLPDLLVHPAAGYAFGIPLLMEKKIFREVQYPYDYVGTHQLEGVVVLEGVQVKDGVKLDAHILDMAPTILALLGLEIPTYMDGQVIQEAFSEKLKIAKKADKLQESRGTQGMSPEEQEEVEKRLRDLGYL